jgi:hypothetical protein
VSNQPISTADDLVAPPNQAAAGPPDGQPRAETRPEATSPESAAPGWRPPDLTAIEQALQLFARAVRQFHTYPATSPLCTDAIAACHKALVSFEGRDQVVLRVMPPELLVDDCGVGGGTIIEHELVGRLHRAGVATLIVDRTASERDLSRFCSDLISVHDGRDGKTTLEDVLAEHGIDKLTPRMAYRPEVVDLGVPRPALCNLVERERARREPFPPSGPPAHLYPPDKGWVRLDPTSEFSSISLVDLAILVDGPAELAAVLLRLTDDEAGAAGSHKSALELKFSDVATLFSSLDPRLARLMFSKLARAVLDLEPERRQSLLQRTILPGLLEGTADGRVLKDFPDVDLAESLCLLLDLETAAPEVLSAALDRMDLPAERRQAMVPLLDAGVQSRVKTGRLRDARAEEEGVDRWARRLLQIDTTAPRNFAEFAAFDLSVDLQTSTAIDEVRRDVQAADVLIVRLRCLSNLVRLEPNPNAVEVFLAGVAVLLDELERASRWQDLASWLVRLRQLADSLRQPRPDVSDAIGAALDGFCTRDRATRVVELYDKAGEPRTLASALVNACGVGITPAFVALLDDPAFQPKARSLVQLMCDHAQLLAPPLAAAVGRTGNMAARAIVRVLGYAGPGCEAEVAGQLGRRDEQVVREALRALARIGSAEAASLVSARIRKGSPWMRSAAQEALCHFPPALFQAQLRELLGRRDFVLHHPDLAARLLDRAVQTGCQGLEELLVPLVSLRYRFWNRALARVGAKARELVKR